MAIYEKFIGRSRDSFTSYEDLHENYHITCPDGFNFAYDVMDVLAAEKPDKRAMVWVGNDFEERIYTFGDIKRESDRAARYLYSKGIRKGDRVLMVLKRSYWFWFLLLGMHKLGAILVPATNMLMAKDYVYRCNAAKVKAVIVTADGDCTDYFDKGEGQYETVEMKFVTKGKQVPGWIDFEAEIANVPYEWEKPQGDDYAGGTDTSMIAFTSGTTGYPKIITHDFRYPLGHIATGVFWHRVVDGGLHFTVSDTGWMKCFWGKMYGQWMGETALLIYDFDKFNGDNILTMLEKYRVTTFCVPPTMYRMILQSDVSKYDLSALTHCCTAGEALNPEIFNKWYAATGLKIHEGFGQSETPVCIATFAPFMEPVPGALGFPSPGFDVHILDANDEQAQRGTVGEICVRADSIETRPLGLLSSYNENAEETAEAYRNGFYHTGDRAYRDEHGMFRFVGRGDDVIKSSGYRIGPFEIESVLMEHDAVAEVAVTGVPDPDGIRGFLVKATIVLADGFEGSPELVKELQTYVKVNTAPYKYPRIVVFTDALPKTFSGKIQRAVIRDRDMQAWIESQKQQ